MEKSAGASSEKVTNHIPSDLAFSILSKLSLKSLKRFGSVHKSWALLFENPHFMNIFRNNFISNHHSFYDDTSLFLHVHRSLYPLSGERFENRVKLDWPNPFQQDDPFFDSFESGGITGTLCLYQRDRFVLWNPTTEELKVIPPSPVESLPPYWDPFIRIQGFGYDHVRDDYKLIRYVCFFRETYNYMENVPYDSISYDPVWEIYSLRSNSWRKLDDVDVPRYFSGVGGGRIYMDGMCHWWGLGASETHNDKAAHFVCSFDLSNEVFFKTPIPLDLDILLDIEDSFDPDMVLRNLVVLNGSIALISWYCDTTTFHISILGEVGMKESWTKLFIVGPLPCVEHPIGAGKKGGIFFRRKDGELVWFDLSTQMIEELGVKSEYWCHIIIYKESLLSIGGINH